MKNECLVFKCEVKSDTIFLERRGTREYLTCTSGQPGR